MCSGDFALRGQESWHAEGEHNMDRHRPLLKILAIVGAILAWFPLVATVATSVMGSLASRTFRLDYLMPGELGLFAFAGGLLLLLVAVLARRRRLLIGASLAVAFIALFGGQALAVATGLASGAREPTGWPWILVLASLALYSFAVLMLAVAGVRLVRDL